MGGLRCILNMESFPFSLLFSFKTFPVLQSRICSFICFAQYLRLFSFCFILFILSFLYVFAFPCMCVCPCDSCLSFCSFGVITLSITNSQTVYRQCHIYNTSEHAEKVRTMADMIYQALGGFHVWGRSVDLRLKFSWQVLLYHRLNCQDSDQGCCRMHDRILRMRGLIQPCYLSIAHRAVDLYILSIHSSDKWFMVSPIFPEVLNSPCYFCVAVYSLDRSNPTHPFFKSIFNYS